MRRSLRRNVVRDTQCHGGEPVRAIRVRRAPTETRHSVSVGCIGAAFRLMSSPTGECAGDLFVLSVLSVLSFHSGGSQYRSRPCPLHSSLVVIQGSARRSLSVWRRRGTASCWAR